MAVLLVSVLNDFRMIYQVAGGSSAGLHSWVECKRRIIQVSNCVRLELFGMFTVSPDCLSGRNVIVQVKVTPPRKGLRGC